MLRKTTLMICSAASIAFALAANADDASRLTKESRRTDTLTANAAGTTVAERIAADFPGTFGTPRETRAIIADLAKGPERPDYLTVARSDSGGGGRENLRAYLGTIPDYATEVPGVKLSGVRGGGPADKAGLKGGDIIVEFGGKKIANIYDYTYALELLRVNQAVKVVYLRNGERRETMLTPAARR